MNIRHSYCRLSPSSISFIINLVDKNLKTKSCMGAFITNTEPNLA